VQQTQAIVEGVAYWSSVIVADLCPSIFCTTLMSAPAAMARLAAVWRSFVRVQAGHADHLGGGVERAAAEDRPP